jgi:acetyltransferase-like isoleucine patch superfamily enzyme
MKKMIKTILKFFTKHTQKYVWAIARMYNIRVEIPVNPHGRFSVEIEGGEEQIRHCIPPSVYFNTASGKIQIGKGTSFGYDVKLVTGKHMNLNEAKESGKTFHYVTEKGRDIIIGRNCFIGTGAIIIGPVTIGDYTVVGAGSIVTKDLDSKSFYVGSPAKKKRVFE